MSDEDDKVVQFVPLPRITREEDQSLDPAPVVKALRALELDPYVATDPDGSGGAVAVEAEVGTPLLRIRVDLAGERRGSVRVHVLTSERHRALVAHFPPSEGTDIDAQVADALRACRDLGAAISRACRAVR